ncbi:hypothetical protein B0H15DRAFT_805714 [Mycena belliarum]|uniref:Uncharacterized protein n=1 Tax=Mycena belliarum TaxID=1033014 RepID=A0AAD6TVL9_9AGAR|nr:hypothetical protein B0H15DRAFT_805714 [Mycena belliae]
MDDIHRPRSNIVCNTDEMGTKAGDVATHGNDDEEEIPPLQVFDDDSEVPHFFRTASQIALFIPGGQGMGAHQGHDSQALRSVHSASPTKTAKEDILKGHGLHGVKHFLWDFRFSDPYAAYSYDTLHSDDLGKWGHHLWPLLLARLEELNQKGPFAENAIFTPFCNTRLDVFIQDYEYWCSKVAAVYGKSFDFFKQHAMVRIDETQEAIARIRMAIDNFDKAQDEESDKADETPVDPQSTAHWAFGAPVPGRLMNSRALEEANNGSLAFRNFDFRLRQFISDTFPEDPWKIGVGHEISCDVTLPSTAAHDATACSSISPNRA